MGTAKKVKVLVIDDSLIFRETVAKGIAADRGIEVVGTATDPFDARDKIIDLEPDVLTLDVEMPRMNGIEFLKKLMPQYPLPVVVVSAVSDNVFDALNAGAVDFVTKPDGRMPGAMDNFINELIIKVKIASTASLKQHHRIETPMEQLKSGLCLKADNPIIAIGASTGGTEAIYEIIRAFPEDMPGIVITQHMPPVFTKMYANRLNSSCRMEVKEAEHGDVVSRGKVLIAPGDFHMRLNRKGSVYSVECLKGERVNGHCPSVDVLFESVADKAGPSAIGVILTGMGYDGAKGLLRMRQRGAVTIGQNEQSSVVYGMPKVAFDLGAVQKQADIKDISKLISSLLRENL